MKAFGLILFALLPPLLGWGADSKALEGKWRWNMRTGGGDFFMQRAQLKVEGEKVTGAILRGGGSSPIQEGIIKDGKVSFKTERKRNNGPAITSSYEGTFDGEKIFGKIKITGFANEQQERVFDWNAERDIPTTAGNWKWLVTPSSGQSYETTLEAKQEGEKIIGVVRGRSGTEWPIRNGELNGDQVKFQVVRERDGQEFVFTYTGKLDEDTIKGTQEWKWPGDSKTSEWEARRFRR